MVRLYGSQGVARIQQAHVCVVGIGGVGSWTVEALARSGIGHLTLIDLDSVAESNINRQVHALENTLGQAKVHVMAERIAQINPTCQVTCVEDFLTPENVTQLLTPGFDFIVDASDQVSAKCAMLAHARKYKIAIVTVGAAGGKTAPTGIQLLDLSRTTHDPLLANVRARLRRDYGFSRGDNKLGIAAVFSTQAVARPITQNTEQSTEQTIDSACELSDNHQNPSLQGSLQDSLQGLSCAGYGSAMHVTASFGLCAAGYVLNQLGGVV